MRTNCLTSAILILIYLNAIPNAPSFAQETPPEKNLAAGSSPPVELPELQKELAERVQRDQAARFKLIEVMQQQSAAPPKTEASKTDASKTGASKADATKADPKPATNDADDAKAKSADLFHELSAIDDDNRAWLKTIVEKHGWPSKKLVGEKGAHDAWLLVQHADADREFQKLCLAKMEQLAEGEVSKVDVAYLTDRVLVADKKPQLYGTQCHEVDGKFQPLEVADPTNLDRRRASIGLPPIADYLRSMQEMYKGKQ